MRFFVKFFVFFAIFISLIAYCSFSFAVTNVEEIAVDLAVMDSSLTTFNLYDDLKTRFSLSDEEILSLNNGILIDKGSSTSYYTFLISNHDSTNFYLNGVENSQLKIKGSGSYYAFEFRKTDGQLSSAPYSSSGTGTTYVQISSGKVIANYLYSDSSLSELFDDSNSSYPIDSENVTFFNNAFNSSISNIDMLSVVNGMATELSLDNLYSVVGSAIPIIVIAVLFVFGFIIVRIILKKVSKGKSAY